MNIEQKIKEIEETYSQAINHKPITEWELRDFLGEALEVINHLQSEVERYKSLWETNAAESKEIIAELKGKDEWQPIETAPKDGRMFLVLLKRQGNLIVRARYDPIHNYFLNDYETEGGVTRVSYYHDGDLWHDMPALPKPPKQNH